MGDVNISGTEHKRKFKISMQIYHTHTHMNTILFEYCHASVTFDNVDVLYLEDGNV